MELQLKSEEDLEPVFKGPRKFKFVELFAGMAGLSKVVAELCGDCVDVLDPLDVYEDWDILDDSHYTKSKQLVDTIDWMHLAFPCRSFSRARRSDEHGNVEVVRSEAQPDGWGHPVAEEGNAILKRSAALGYLLCDADKFFSFENPEWSYAWLTTVMLKFMKYTGQSVHGLDQCPYGAETVKPTGLVTQAPWLKSVNLRCGQVRPHRHREEGLTGKTWDPLTEQMVWRSSKAAEYPTGLCIAWAVSLRKWLCSEAGTEWLAKRTLVRIGKFSNALIRADFLSQSTSDTTLPSMPSSSTYLSRGQIREQENVECVGGLRDPRRAVARSKPLQLVGQQLRACLDPLLSNEVLEEFENADGQLLPNDLIWAARQRLAQTFHTEVLKEGYQSEIIHAVLSEANDPDTHTLHEWLTSGFPLGISEGICNNGIFPKTDEVSAAIKASQAMGELLEDWDGSAKNYKSFEEAGNKAQHELDRLVADGRADRVNTWEEVVEVVGEEAKLTKMACIVKMKGGQEKVRIVVDMRRSGINGRMVLLERVVLPRVSDVAMSVHELLKSSGHGSTPEFFIADFKDAFYTLKLKESERANTVVKGNDGSYYIMRCVCFGLACGPTLWGRMAAMAMRVSQAATLTAEGRVQCYVDDPIIIGVGPTRRDRSRIFCRYLLIWCSFGFPISWGKISRGTSVDWIGVALSLVGETGKDLQIVLPPEKTAKLLDAFGKLISESRKGMVPASLLQATAGLMAWVANVIPMARPWASALWAALTASRTNPVRETTRVRKGLVFWKQLQHAVLPLMSMMQVATSHVQVAQSGSVSFWPCLQKVYRFLPDVPLAELYTDACPSGLGAVICVGTRPVGFWMHKLTPEDASWMGPSCVLGDPAFQTEWETWCVLLAIRVFCDFFQQGKMRIFLRSDNVATIQAALTFKASSPVVNFIAGELVLELEALGQSSIEGRHIRGIHNDWADSLSRGVVPADLKCIPQFMLPDSMRLLKRVQLQI